MRPCPASHRRAHAQRHQPQRALAHVRRHRLHVEDRQVGIQFVQDSPERRHERRRLRRGAHHQRDRRHILLRQRQEEERARFLADHHVLAVANHPDDFGPVALTSSHPESPADGVFPGPQLFRHRRVDERHALRLRGVGSVEAAAAEQPRAGRLEKPRTDDVEADGEGVVLRARNRTVDGDIRYLDAVAERHVHGDRGRRDARQRLRPVEQIVDEALTALVGCTVAVRGRPTS